MSTGFTAHNIRLDDGTETLPSLGWTIDQSTVLRSVRRILELIYPDGLSGRSIVDLGCLEGGYTAEFARLGMEATGIEARESNYQNCLVVKAGIPLQNLEFVRDDANNIAKYGPFDAVFACGLLYHLDSPRQFLTSAAKVCHRVLFLQTHVARAEDTDAIRIHGLSEVCENEGLRGRWYTEHGDVTPEQLDLLKWHSWANHRSFWIQKEYLLQLLRDLGFDIILEQFDFMGDIAFEMTKGNYKTDDRNLIVAIKSRDGSN
jgi:SAM-dependent methyltransferase